MTQLTEVINDFSLALNNKKQIDAIFLDMSKAFDRVPHDQLIHKLMQLGINHNVVKWITAYLTGRTQFVEICGSKSRELEVTSGVPQGSVLGPVLFLAYINDIASDVDETITVRLFADDCLIYREINDSNDQTQLGKGLASIENWCERWKMKLNKEKTVALRVTNKTKHVHNFTYTLNSGVISTVNAVKYLGVTINNDLSWASHITNICSAAERKLWFLRRKLRLAPTSVKLSAFLTIVRPTLEYASVIWDPHHKGLIEKLEKVQRKAARFILSRYSRTDSVSNMLEILNLPTLLDRRTDARLKFFFSLTKNAFNIKTTQYLIPKQGRDVRGTNSRAYRVPQLRINTYAYSFFPRTIRQWNALPESVVQSRTVSEFERQIHAVSNADQS